MSNDPPPVPPSEPPVPPPLSYATPAQGTYMGPPPDADAKMWAMLVHISAIVAYFIAIPILGPLIIWLMKKNEMPFVDDQGKEALNFHITLFIVLLLTAATFCIGIGLILMPIVVVGSVILIVIAAMKANEGVAYRYPFTIRLIK
jgi:uncharacterized Tic20 family protein